MLYILSLLLLLVACERNAGGTIVDNPPDAPQTAVLNGEIQRKDGTPVDSGMLYVYHNENPYSPFDSLSFKEGSYHLEVDLVDSAEITLNFLEGFEYASLERNIKINVGDTLNINTELLSLFKGDVLRAIEGESGIYSGDDFSDLSIPFFYLQPTTNGSNWVTYYLPDSDLELQMFIKGDSTVFAIDRQNDTLQLDLIYGKLLKPSEDESLDTLASVWQEVSFLYGDAGTLPQFHLKNADTLLLSFWNPADFSLNQLDVSTNSNVARVIDPVLSDLFDGTGVLEQEPSGTWWLMQKSADQKIRPGVFRLQDSTWLESLNGSSPLDFPNPIRATSLNTWDFKAIFQEQRAWLSYREQGVGLKVLTTQNYQASSDSILWEQASPSEGLGASTYFDYNLMDRGAKGVLLSYRFGENADSLKVLSSLDGNSWSEFVPALYIGGDYGAFSGYDEEMGLWVSYTSSDSVIHLFRNGSATQNTWEELPLLLPNTKQDMRKAQFTFTSNKQVLLSFILLNPDQVYHFIYDENQDQWFTYKDMSDQGVSHEWDTFVAGGYFWFAWVDVDQSNRIRLRKIEIPQS